MSPVVPSYAFMPVFMIGFGLVKVPTQGQEEKKQIQPNQSIK
jgi:hypothetical protein